MQLKPGVRLLGVRPELIIAMMAAETVWKRQNAELVVTSVIDGVHTRASEHYAGCAFDLRAHSLPEPTRATNELRSALGGDFDVIEESIGTANHHIHVEFQPKLAY